MQACKHLMQIPCGALVGRGFRVSGLGAGGVAALGLGGETVRPQTSDTSLFQTVVPPRG